MATTGIRSANLVTFSGVNLRREPLDIQDHELRKSLGADLVTHPGSILVRLARTGQNKDAIQDLIIRAVARINGRRYRVAGKNLYGETAPTFAYTTKGERSGIQRDNVIADTGISITLESKTDSDPWGIFAWEKQQVDGDPVGTGQNVITYSWESAFDPSAKTLGSVNVKLNFADLGPELTTTIVGARPLNDNKVWAFIADTSLMLKDDGTNRNWGIDLIPTPTPQIANLSQPQTPAVVGDYFASVTQIRWTAESSPKVAHESNGRQSDKLTVT